MAKHKIAFVTPGKTDVSHVEEGLAGLDYDLDIHVCSSQGEVIEAIKGADVIINRGVPMPREVIEEIDTAKAIVSSGHGFDRVDDEAATDKGVIVANTAGFVTEEVANHTIMLLLACAKNLVGLNNAMKAGEWASYEALGRPMPLIYGEVFGLVGMGNIGRATVRRAQAFGLDVAVYDPFLPTWTAQEYRIRLVSSLEELASQSDYVAILTPLNPHTRKLLGASFFRAMKPTAYFINCCRGGTVDEEALIEALRNEEIAGAGLDVFEQEPTPPDNPLLKMDNVIVTPHTAGASDASSIQGERRLGEEAARILKGTWPMSLVNPAVRARVPGRAPAVNNV